MEHKENIEEVHNSVIISLATCGGIVHDFNREYVLLTVTFPNPNKYDLNREIFETFKVSKEKFEELKEESYELHIQISGMIEEEEAKKAEEDKRIEEEKRIKMKELRLKKKSLEKDNTSSKEKDVRK